jgi:hypothetical protein
LIFARFILSRKPSICGDLDCTWMPAQKKKVVC